MLLKQDRKTREVKEMGGREETLPSRVSFASKLLRQLRWLRLELGVLPHIYNPNPWEVNLVGPEFQASLSYVVSPRPAWAIRQLVSKKQTNKRKKKDCLWMVWRCYSTVERHSTISKHTHTHRDCLQRQHFLLFWAIFQTRMLKKNKNKTSIAWEPYSCDLCV